MRVSALILLIGIISGSTARIEKSLTHKECVPLSTKQSIQKTNMARLAFLSSLSVIARPTRAAANVEVKDRRTSMQRNFGPILLESPVGNTGSSLNLASTAFANSPADTSRQGTPNEFISGLASGAVSRISKEIIIHPIDTVRARMLVTSDQNQTDSSTDGLFDNLYDGVLPALVGGIPAGALFFGVKDWSKSRLRAAGLSKPVANVAAVCITNVPYWLLRGPAEVLKTRQQTDRGKQTTVREIIGDLWNEKRRYISERDLEDGTTGDGRSVEGIRGVIRGLYGSYASNYLYATPTDIVKFLAYESIVDSLGFGGGPSGKIGGLEAAAVGAASGLLAQLSTAPLDLARTRIMASDSQGAPNSENPLTVLSKVVETEGYPALFKGTAPRVLRAVASGAVQFASYEITQNSLK